MVERFRDEIGDWRVCILTPFGGRVHAPWGMALTARLRDSVGLDAQSIWSDDGIALHLPEADAPPSLADLLIGPDEIEELVVGEVGQTALFGARFRENASRALLIPRRRPGQRTPLWQQRLKAQNLLQVARKYGSFPIILETYRECLQDVFDLPALKNVLRGLQTRELDLVEVETASASPFASSLLFDYVATYMYEDDTPPAERRAQALSLDRDLLRELLGQEELRELIDPDALAEVERQLAGDPRDPDELHDVLRRRGDLRAGEYDEAQAAILLAERRALTARIAGEERLVAAEDAGRYRDALGVMPPGGLPEAFLEGGSDSLRQLLLRFAKSRGPFTTAEAADRFGLDVDELLHDLERADLLVRGELRPGGTEREWCDPDVLRRLRRASLAALRREVEPAEQAALGRFLPAWHGIGRRATLREALVPLQGLALPVSLWESEVLPRRVPGYQPSWLDGLCAAGELVWVGAGLDRVAVYFREDAPVLGRPAGAPPPETAEADAIRAALGRGAMFWADLLDETGLEAEAGAAGVVGARLGGRGHERRVDAAPCRPPLRGAESATPSAPLLAHPRRRDHLDPGPLVADRPPLPRHARPARARRAPARAAGDRHPRRCPRRGDSRRLQRRLLGAEGSRDDRRLQAGLLRRGPRRGAVRSRRRGRAAPRAPVRGGARATRARRRRSGSALRRRAALAEAGGCARRPRRRSAGRRSWAERRRSSSSAAAGRSCRCASPTRTGFVRRSRRSSSTCAAGGGKRLAVERFDGRPVTETEVMPLLLEAGFLAGPRARRPSALDARGRAGAAELGHGGAEFQRRLVVGGAAGDDDEFLRQFCVGELGLDRRARL